MSYHDTHEETLKKRYRLRMYMTPYEKAEAREFIANERMRNFQPPKPPDERIVKFHTMFDRFKKLSPQLLIAMIDELALMDLLICHPYEEMTRDVYQKAKNGFSLSDKQKMVLIHLLMTDH